MNIRKALLAFSIAVAGVPFAYANTGSTWVGGEAGFQDHARRSASSAAQVRQELDASRASPILHDGTVPLRGEAGYVFAGDSFVRNAQSGSQRAQAMGMNAGEPRAAAPMSEAQLRDYRLQYIN